MTEPVPAPPNVVFTDFGETLATVWPPRERLFADAATTIGLSLETPAVRRAYQTVDFGLKFSSVDVQGPSARDEFYRRYNGLLCEALGISSYADRLDPHLRTAFTTRREWRLLPGAKRALAALRQKAIPVVVVANWDRDLPSLATRLGIGHLVTAIVASQAVGAEKPQAAMFEYARRAAGLTMGATGGAGAHVVHIGDDYRSDVLGARAAGLAPVLIDRAGRYPHADCPRFRSFGDWVRSTGLERDVLS